ncbi:MAG: hypothetical protein ACYS9T_00320 [Planctomycetota bacterium]|jgi:hypothetical protein
MAGRENHNAAGPLRHVAWPIRARLLFGGRNNQVGWVALGFSLIFVWMFTLNSDLTSWYYFRAETETTKGKVLWSRKTRFSTGGSSLSVGGIKVRSSSGRAVYAIGYAFHVNGNKYESTSYQTGGSLAAGTEVTVEYVTGRPRISRIKALRRATLGPIGLVAALIPLAALVVVTRGLVKGIRAIRLLTIGKLTTGRLISKKVVGPFRQHQKVPSYKLVFEFTDETGKTHEAKTQTQWTERLEDEEKEALLYNPLRPSYAALLDGLPASPRIDENGDIQLKPAGKRLSCLVVPGITVIGHGLYLILCLLF